MPALGNNAGVTAAAASPERVPRLSPLLQDCFLPHLPFIGEETGTENQSSG